MNAAGSALAGGCHCRALRYVLEWPGHVRAIPARRCTCGYCTRFNGTWTSHPDARLEITARPGSRPGRYRFGTQTADFLFCPVCGVTVAALCRIGGYLRAVINVNTLDSQRDLQFDHGDSDFDGESVAQRLDRRTRRWIGNVTIEPGL